MTGCLPGWQRRILDGNHLPASDKRPSHTLVVYDPDSALVCDIVACVCDFRLTLSQVRSPQTLMEVQSEFTTLIFQNSASDRKKSRPRTSRPWRRVTPHPVRGGETKEIAETISGQRGRSRDAP